MREMRRRQRGFADLELGRHGVRLEPVLEQISQFLDQHSDLLRMVHADLVRGLKQHQRGRAGLTAEQVLRAFVLQRVKNWDYRELRERIADGFTLRQFTRDCAIRIAAISSKSSKTGRAPAPRSSPANSRRRSGTTTSRTPPRPMPSAIGSSIRPIGLP
jgi:hypothetical protein